MEMGEQAAQVAQERRIRSGIGERLRSNPVIVKELRGRMRGFRAFAVLSAYLLLLAGLVILVYLLIRASNTSFSTVDQRQVLGKTIFGMVVGLELMAISFIAPGLTAGAISSERERQTFDLLRTTLLPARSIVLGKFFAAFLYVLLLIFASLPIQSLSFLFGGVALEEVLISTLMLIITAMTFCAVSLFFSSLLARTLVSTVLSYAFAILWVFGLPFILLLFSSMFGAFLSSANTFNSTTQQVILFVGAWLLVSLNPLGAAIASEAILLENGDLFIFTLPLPNGPPLTLISPWIIYVAAALLTSLALLWLSVKFVRRVEK